MITELSAARVQALLAPKPAAISAEAKIRVVAGPSLADVQSAVEVIEQWLSAVRATIPSMCGTGVMLLRIQTAVADEWNIKASWMTTPAGAANVRKERYAWPRQVAIHLARTITGKSLSQIGRAFGGRDHGTVFHAMRVVRARMETEPATAERVRRLEERLRKELA